MSTTVVQIDKSFLSKMFFYALIIGLLLYIVRIGYVVLSIKFNSSNTSLTTVYDRNGNIVYKQENVDEGLLDYREINAINSNIVDAIISSEDKNFRHNIGIDIPRLLKCTYTTFFKNELCGASTITQQYIKLERGNTDRSVVNKVDEIVLSMALTTVMSKDEILEKYLNKAYFGNLRYGINSASKGYFNLDNIDLNLAQSTFLVAIINSPSQYDPYSNYENVKLRQELILESMWANGYISEEEFKLAIETPIEVGNFVSKIEAPHFVNYVLKSNPAKEVHSTMDLDLYREILKVVRSKMEMLKQYNATNASVVVLDAKSGEILTMIGSVDYFSKEIEGQVNSALSVRNPGSTMKPFVYGYAFTKDVTPSTLIDDSEQIIKTFDGGFYFPRNYDRLEHGWVSVREAIGNSFNIPAVVTLVHASKDDRLSGFYDFMESIGLEEAEEQQSDIAAALGGFSVSLLDLTNAYRIFPNQGEYLGNPISIMKESSQIESNPILGENSKEIAYIMSNILDDEESRRRIFGTLNTYNLPFKASVKSGTTTDFNDSWTIGYTDDFVVGVWVGNNDHSQMKGVTGTAGAGEIWRDTMLIVDQYYTQRGWRHSNISNFEELDIEEFDICSTTGEIFDNNCEGFSYSEIFVSGKNPHDIQISKKISIINPNLVEIISPSNNDTFFGQDTLRLEIEFHPNSNFDNYQLIVDENRVVAEQQDYKFFADIPLGRHSIRVEARNQENIISSSPIFINIDNDEN